MKKNTLVIAIMICFLTLSACQNDAVTKPNVESPSNSSQNNEETDTNEKNNAAEAVSMASIYKQDERDIIKLKTSDTSHGTPDYAFHVDKTNLMLTLDDQVLSELSDLEIPTHSVFDSIQLLDEGTEADLQINTKEDVHWKVYAVNQELYVEAMPLGLAGKRIVIDPGHGGENTGTYGRVSNILEKEINLQVGLLLKDQLEKEGATVIMTRTDDSLVYQGELGKKDNNETDFMLDFVERVGLSHEVEADVFISLHTDNFPADLSINGTATYIHSAWPHAFQNEELAQLIGQGVAEAIDTKWNGVKDIPFIVLRKHYLPAVLIELAFLSNANDEAKLIDPVHQEEMAKAITEALQTYFE